MTINDPGMDPADLLAEALRQNGCDDNAIADLLFAAYLDAQENDQ
ncbi:hypothetical protein N5079_19950 [Planotetraspora sp. A-T 1434]|nr:hypothetical protein [Planotetraspora sp. A-T 1434]MCT9932479.1 hypothetical protein [Planotetraspora sp. A-T 1434]